LRVEDHTEVCVQLPTHADNTALPAFASRTPLLLLGAGCASIDLCLLPAEPTLGQTDRQTDGRTQCRYIDPVPHTMRAVPINSERCKYSVLLKQKKNLNRNSGRVGNLRVTFSRLTVSGCRASTKHPRSTTCECKGGLTSAELN